MKCILKMNGDTLECLSRASATRIFQHRAKVTKITTATLHYNGNNQPDFTLTLGPRGRVAVVRAIP